MALASKVQRLLVSSGKPQNRKTAKPQNRKTAKPQNRKTAKPQNRNKLLCLIKVIVNLFN